MGTTIEGDANIFLLLDKLDQNHKDRQLAHSKI